ncbi:hypothetical protein JXO59_04135 [candidate division KSB1 bacterium]|nr:hypothetical protein [candidate division KSB1 bacterium]
MGILIETKCLDCGRFFNRQEGGGFSFHLLRCDKCGKLKAIGFKKLGELYLRFLKGLKRPYAMATSEHDEYVQKRVTVEPISEDEYYNKIEEIAGHCRCRGKYTFDAPPRCPHCRSTNLEDGRTVAFYD